MEEITGFGMKDCLSSPGLGRKYFNSLRTEDEPIYSYNDKYMRSFVRESIKGGRISVFDQYYKSRICDDILNCTSEEFHVKGNIYDIIEAYLEYKNKHFEIIKKQYESNFNDCRDINEEKMEKYINEKFGKLPIHQLLKQIKVDGLRWDFDVVSLYPSTMWDENSIYPRIETGCAFTKDISSRKVQYW